MRLAFALTLFLIPFALPARGPDEGVISALIKKLGSTEFRERQTSTEALKKLPKAAPALREALRSSDKEVARRAAEILAYFHLAEVREITRMVKEGRVERAIELLVAVPPGKFDHEVWTESRALAQAIIYVHEKQGEKKSTKPFPSKDTPTLIYRENAIDKFDFPYEGHYFARSRNLDINLSQSKGNRMYHDLFVVANGTVRLRGMIGDYTTILAGKSVELHGDFGQSLIVSAGDVTLAVDMTNVLIIARGNVNLVGGKVSNSRVICGRSLVADRRFVRSCTITENEPNPLGYIRWADAPKEKAAPKSK